MAHYALLDENNFVVDVIVGESESEEIDWEEEYSKLFGMSCKRTSYNTHNNEHTDGKTPFRKNYATIGGSYLPNLDGFCEPQPYPSWTLNEETCAWEPPYQPPNEEGIRYMWIEDSQTWEPYKRLGE
jgi:hypothetical protein